MKSNKIELGIYPFAVICLLLLYFLSQYLISILAYFNLHQIQWLYVSARLFKTIFWYLSMIGSLISIIYFTVQSFVNPAKASCLWFFLGAIPVLLWLWRIGKMMFRAVNLSFFN